MANHEQGEVELKSDGKTYTLVLKTSGLAALQKRFSPPGMVRDLDVVLSEVMRGCQAGSLEHIIAMFWASLQKHYPGTTYEETADIIDAAGGVKGVGEQLAGLNLSATPDPKDLEELRPTTGNPRKAQPQTRGVGASSTSKRAPSPA